MPISQGDVHTPSSDAFSGQNASRAGKGPLRPLVVIWWTVTVAWAMLIFYLSTQSFGASSTQILLAWGFDLLHIHISGQTLVLFNEVIRKLAHLTEYAVFSLLLYGPPDERGRNLWKPRRALLSVLIAALYSLTDEFHQIFVPGRGPSLRDCSLDTLGAALAMLVPFTSHQIYLQKSNQTVAR